MRGDGRVGERKLWTGCLRQLAAANTAAGPGQRTYGDPSAATCVIGYYAVNPLCQHSGRHPDDSG
jgi:hypothetical protein